MALPRIVVCASGMMLCLAACGNPPGLEAGATLPASDPEVALLPLDEVLAQAADTGTQSASAAALAARAARLRARAVGN